VHPRHPTVVKKTVIDGASSTHDDSEPHRQFQVHQTSKKRTVDAVKQGKNGGCQSSTNLLLPVMQRQRRMPVKQEEW
jgi:hypothetical protein